jgi:hypothetical protein
METRVYQNLASELYIKGETFVGCDFEFCTFFVFNMFKY